MPLVVSAKLSADVGNSAALGSDGGLYAPLPTGDTNPGYIVDNSWASAGSTFYYQLGASYTSTTVVYPIGTALLEPVMLIKDAKVGSLSINITSGGTGASNLYYALFASNPATGWPAGKIADWGSIAANSQGVLSPTIPATAQTLAGRTLYWIASWASGTLGPTVTARQAMSAYPMRQPVMPSSVSASTYAFLDTSVAWGSQTSAPATLSPTMTAATAQPATTPPMFWLQLTN